MSETVAQSEKDARAPAVTGALLSVPLALVMLLAALAIGIGAGLSGKPLLHALDAGFGATLAEYAFILYPCLHFSRLPFALDGQAGSGGPSSCWLPWLCRHGLSRYRLCRPFRRGGSAENLDALRGLCGFKLFVPAAGPIVGTGLGGFDARLAVAAVPVFFAAWITGLLFARRFETAPLNGAADARAG